jgi:hypothetical protein
MFRIIYPERRIVSNELLLTWYTDAVANGQVDDLGACSATQAACALHRAGLITLRDAYTQSTMSL